MARTVPVQDDLTAVRNLFDRVFADTFGANPFRGAWTTVGNGTMRMPLRLDAYSTDKDVVILAAVPGVRPDDLDITIDKNTVTLTGKAHDVTQAEEAKDATWYLHELTAGEFSRSLTIPFEIDSEKVEATFENGILRLVLPKAESAKPRKIEVKVSQPKAIEAEANAAD